MAGRGEAARLGRRLRLGIRARTTGAGCLSGELSGELGGLAETILEGEAESGVLFCGAGLGMSMAANRHRGIRAALCHDHYTASVSRRHNDANVLVLGGRILGPDLAREIVDTWLDTPFEGGRHLRRVERIDK